MPALEDITYSDDEEDVGAEADFSNLETAITVSPIPKTRVHKDHPVTQIIGDFSLATQRRSMTRMVKDQDGLTQINNEDFHTCMFACILSHEEPKRVNERQVLDELNSELTFFLGLQAKQKPDGIFISQDKYVAEILKKFGLTDGKSASTSIYTEKPLLKDPDAEDVDVHTYSDYAGASLDRKSTTWGCQFLGCRLIFWQCKKHKVVATLSTEAKYVTAASCYAQVLWIQNQLLDYGANGIWEKVLITVDTVRQALRLDDAESIDCLPNEEIFAELVRMGYEKPSTKLTFYKLIISAQVGDLTSDTTKYTSPALTQKVFANMKRAGKGFSRVNTLLFKGMLVPQQAADDVDDVVAENVPADVVADVADDVIADDVIIDDVVDVVAHVATEPIPPSPTPTTTPSPLQELPSTS
nr:copia protein [Tanacetum cinerariifolium]